MPKHDQAAIFELQRLLASFNISFPSSSVRELKKAYIAKIKNLHPDLNGGVSNPKYFVMQKRYERAHTLLCAYLEAEREEMIKARTRANSSEKAREAHPFRSSSEASGSFKSNSTSFAQGEACGFNSEKWRGTHTFYSEFSGNRGGAYGGQTREGNRQWSGNLHTAEEGVPNYKNNLGFGGMFAVGTLSVFSISMLFTLYERRDGVKWKDINKLMENQLYYPEKHNENIEAFLLQARQGENVNSKREKPSFPLVNEETKKLQKERVKNSGNCSDKERQKKVCEKASSAIEMESLSPVVDNQKEGGRESPPFMHAPADRDRDSFYLQRYRSRAIGTLKHTKSKTSDNTQTRDEEGTWANQKDMAMPPGAGHGHRESRWIEGYGGVSGVGIIEDFEDIDFQKSMEVIKSTKEAVLRPDWQVVGVYSEDEDGRSTGEADEAASTFSRNSRIQGYLESDTSGAKRGGPKPFPQYLRLEESIRGSVE